VSELELWTYEQAGEHCGGATAKTYRSYIVRRGAPQGDRFDPVTGRKQVPAHLVREWWANRPGRGSRTDLKKS
jgi:hypothetical protein